MLKKKKHKLFRKICLLLILYVLVSLSNTYKSNAQTRIDSLLTNLKTVEEDTNKVNLYIDLSIEYLAGAPEKSLSYAEKARKLSLKIEYNLGLGQSYDRIGQVHLQHNNYEQAIEYFEKCIKIYIEEGNLARLSIIYNQTGTIFYYIADYDKAIDHYFKCMETREQIGDKAGVASVYNNIGIIYNTQRNHQKALEYHFKSLGIDKDFGNMNGIATSYNNIGEIYREQGKYDRALEYYFKSLEIQEKEGNLDRMATAYGNIGLIYQTNGDLDKALEYHLKGMEIKEKGGDSYNLIESYNSLGSFYILAKQYEKAKEQYQKALRMANELGMLLHARDASRGLSEIFALQKDYKQAYEYQLMNRAISDSIVQKESLKKITQLEMQVEFDRQEKEKEFERQKQITLFTAKQKRQKIYNYIILGGFFAALLLILAIFRGYRIKQKSNNLLEKQKIQIIEEKKKSEDLLLNILPKRTADELKKYGRATSKRFDKVSIMFADFVGFTILCENLNTLDLIYELDYYFSEFDAMLQHYVIEKIKTIGDAYLCAGGIPYKNETNPIEVVLLGLEMQNFMKAINEEKVSINEPEWKLRIGVHTGEVVTGVVGTIKFGYDIWGDSVNTASRMEQASEPSKVNISSATYEYIKDYFECTQRGKVEVKNKGEIEMYYVERIKPEFSQDPEGIFPSAEFLATIVKLREGE